MPSEAASAASGAGKQHKNSASATRVAAVRRQNKCARVIVIASKDCVWAELSAYYFARAPRLPCPGGKIYV